MNSSMVINYARKGSGYRGWYLNKTLGGKCLLRVALSKEFGKRKKSFKNGTAKYEKQTEKSVETRYISDKFKPFLSKVANYNDEGKKVFQSIYYQNPNNPRQRSSLTMNDYTRYGKRVYIFSRYSYNEETHGWNLDYSEKTTMQYNNEGISAKKVINDYLAKTHDIITRIFTKNPQ